jgi:hypothetical protein
MAASFGVTGGLSNPYMINFTTEGDITPKSQKKIDKKIQERIQENASRIGRMYDKYGCNKDASLLSAKLRYEKEIERIENEKHGDNKKKSLLIAEQNYKKEKANINTNYEYETKHIRELQTRLEQGIEKMRKRLEEEAKAEGSKEEQKKTTNNKSNGLGIGKVFKYLIGK